MKLDNETRELAFKLSHGYCRCSKECNLPANQIHHMLSNTKVNRELYPNFINSIFNLCPINDGCHLNKPVPRITPHEAEIYEKYLTNLIDKAI